ncbi:MAG: dephospho-CoA kinase [Pseudomonadota bacterium]
MILGLTGSIGMGKTTTAAMFRDLGLPVWDADAAVHRLYGIGGAAVSPVAAAFPGTVRDGVVDRSALRKALSQDPDGFARLEAIVHPLVAADRMAFLETQPRPVVLDIPLLFETGQADQMDRIAVVTVPPDLQRERVLARGTMDVATFEAILAKQTPDAEKRTRADYVIETIDMDSTRRQVAEIAAELRKVA